MYKLKLIIGLSCKAGKVRATKAQPFVEVKEKAEAENALATGYFELVSAAEDDGKGGEATPQKMTEKQLEAYAVENGISLTGCKNKAEKLAKILEPKTPPAADGKGNPEEKTDGSPEDDGKGGEADFGEGDE